MDDEEKEREESAEEEKEEETEEGEERRRRRDTLNVFPNVVVSKASAHVAFITLVSGHIHSLTHERDELPELL